MRKKSNNAFLHDTKHFPAVDNQGEVRSCYSQSFTYIQFTNAISRKIDHDNWNPCLMKSSCFSPRFTYLLSRSSPDKMYNFIKDHGCLTLDRFSFKKDVGGGSVECLDELPIKESVAWNVDKGAFKSALRYRLSKFDHCSIVDTKPDDLVKKIKEVIIDGNVVVATTKLENWIISELKNDCGKYGKKGENVVVASRRYIPVGHSFAIVGFDDDISVDFAGTTFKGAFLVTCGYGDVWQNKGYVWMLYDAVYPVSKFEVMNNKSIYGGKLYFTLFYDNVKVFSPSHISNSQYEIQDFLFTPNGKVEINGQILTTYFIQDNVTKKYLCYDNQARIDFPTLNFTEKHSNKSVWCIVSYIDLVKWDLFEAKYEEFYDDSYWIFSLDLYLNNTKARCFLDSGLNFYDIGRSVGLSRFNNGDFPRAKSWSINNVSQTIPFVSPIAVCSEYEHVITRRTYSLKDFWYYDWKDDTEVELPKLMVDIELQTVDRESFQINLLRYDRNGNRECYTPSLFRTPHTQYVTGDDYMSFSGVINSELSEVGYFTFQYSDLLNVPYNTNLSDYVWGIEIISVNKHCLTIKNISLVNNNNEVISTIDLSNNPKTLCAESIEYKFI